MASKRKVKSDYLKLGRPLHEGRRGKPASPDTMAVTGILVELARNAAEYLAKRNTDITKEILRLKLAPDEQAARQLADQRARFLGIKETKKRGKAKKTISDFEGWIEDLRNLQEEFSSLELDAGADQYLRANAQIVEFLKAEIPDVAAAPTETVKGSAYLAQFAR